MNRKENRFCQNHFPSLFLWYSFFLFFFFPFEAKPYFLTVWLTLSFPFCVLYFHRHPTWLFLLWKGGRCLPGNDRVPLPVSKGIQETQERRTQLESSQAQRGKARKEAWLPKKRGFAETGKPRENRYILESRILKMKEYKNVCVQEKKN